MLLLWVGFWIISLPVVVHDLHTHRIPNVYLKILAGLTCIFVFFDGMGSIINLTACLICVSTFLVMGVGKGDIKLLALTFTIFNSQMDFSLTIFLFILLCSTVVHILIITTGTSRLPERIALAPSIFLAFALYFPAR